VVVPLDLNSAPDFCVRIQQQVSARLLLTDEPHLPLDVPSLSLKNLEKTIAARSNQPYPADEIKSDDLVEIIFTSGTTAEPKGVCLTHQNLLANLSPIEVEFRKYARWEKLVHPLRFLCLLPLSHVFGQLMGIFIPQIVGGEVHFRASYKSSEIIDAIKSQRINLIVTVPRVLETLQDKLVQDYALRDQSKTFAAKLTAADSRHFLRNWWTFREIHRRFGWRFWALVTGGATLEADLETFWQRLGFAVIQGYGMTETAAVTSLSHPFRIARGSIGKPVAGEVKLNETGEILVRGNNISPGYWNEGVKSMTDEQGWMHTGDLGEVGPQGDIYFRGRSKDTIVTPAGLKIYPADLEAALDRQPEIKASAVIPTSGATGREPLAVLIPRTKDSNLAAAVQRANESLADFQRIRQWICWPDTDFPRTLATQKVMKRAIAGAVERLVAEKATTPRPRADSEFLPVISKIAGAEAVQLDRSARLADDLKLDSLGRVELVAALEDRYQIELDEGAITATTTVGDVEEIVRQGKAEAIAFPFPEWAMHFPVTWIRPVVYHLFLLPLTLVMCRVGVRGRESLNGVKGPVLFISNHITDVDAALIISALPVRWRLRLAIAMAGELLRDWRYPPAGTGWFARLKLRLPYALAAALFNVFSLPRQSGFRRSFSYAGKAMDHGWSILIFPEGRETLDGKLQPFMLGTGLLAKELNAPVVPIKIDGLFDVKQRHQFFVRPGTVRVTFGKPVQFPSDWTAEQITRELESRLASL
jgi:long-chain acyl-CoA synthetase